MDPSLPSYAAVVLLAVIVANLVTAWLVVLAIGENSGNLFDAGPPWLAAISCLGLLLCYYKVLLPVDLSFWGSAVLAGMGLWGAWVDYTRLSDRRRNPEKRRKAP